MIDHGLLLLLWDTCQTSEKAPTLLLLENFFLFARPSFLTPMHKIATVIGTTGVGKSQLAVELCKALRGQVINADSMQVLLATDMTMGQVG